MIDTAAGRALFEAVPVSDRPAWAANVLRTAARATPELARQLAPVFLVASAPWEWRHGHDVFDDVRDAVLALEEPANARAWVLALAELVAKVSYNASDPDDPFDEDSGWWIARCARGLADLVGDPQFAAELESALGSRPRCR
jgi:hypothetical protein